jgi:hypothetical protein
VLCLSLYLRNSDTSLNGHFDDAANGIVVTQTMGVVTRYFMDLKEMNFFFIVIFLLWNTVHETSFIKFGPAIGLFLM